MLTARSDTDETAREVSERVYRGTHTQPHTHSTYTVPGPLRGINPRCDTARRPSRGSNAGGQAGHCQRYHRATRSFAKPLIQDLTPSPSFMFLAFILGFVSMCGSEEASEIQREDMHSGTRREEN